MAGLFVKLDTTFWEHPKVLAAGERAAVLYLQMLCYAKANLSDGFVPDGMLPRFGLPQTAARATALASAELIERAEGGWRIVGWEERNRTRAEVDRIRAVRAEAGSKGGRPRKQTETNLLSKPEANNNPEYRVQSTETEKPTPLPPTADPSGAATEPEAVAVADSLVAALGFIDPPPATEGERKLVARALRRGWDPEAMRTEALLIAGRDDVREHRSYLVGFLKRCANEDPAAAPIGPCPSTAPPAETRDAAWAAVGLIASRDGASTDWRERTDLSPRARAAAHEARLAIRNLTAKDAKWAFFDAWAAVEVPV